MSLLLQGAEAIDAATDAVTGGGFAISGQTLVTALVGALIALGVPKALSKWQDHQASEAAAQRAHDEKQNASAMTMLGSTLDSLFEERKAEREVMADVQSTLRHMSSQVGSLVLLVQSDSQRREAPRPRPASMPVADAPPIGDYKPAAAKGDS